MDFVFLWNNFGWEWGVAYLAIGANLAVGLHFDFGQETAQKYVRNWSCIVAIISILWWIGKAFELDDHTHTLGWAVVDLAVMLIGYLAGLLLIWASGLSRKIPRK